MCLFLDEAGMAEEQELVAAIYALGNGSEKMRATRDAKERTTTKVPIIWSPCLNRRETAGAWHQVRRSGGARPGVAG